MAYLNLYIQKKALERALILFKMNVQKSNLKCLILFASNTLIHEG
jgi:hypothetical protein